MVTTWLTESFYSIVDEASFRSDMYTCLSIEGGSRSSRTSHYSPVLHNALLASACQLSEDSRANDGVAAALLRASQHELFIEGDRPTLSTIQGVLLIANYFTCIGKHGLGYFYAGIALRMCSTRKLSRGYVD
jgi:hypothetical protein